MCPAWCCGAILLTALPEALRYVGPLQSQWLGRGFIDPSDLRMLLFGLALVLMMLFSAGRLWPSKYVNASFSAVTALLEALQITKRFGGLEALTDVA